MAQAQGKSISELGTAEKYMSPDDLALISQKQNDGTYRSKAVKKEALEKLTIAGNRDDADRSGATYGTLSFLDNSDYHWRSGYITNAYLTDGSNATQMVSVKKCNGEEQHATLAVVVEPDGHRYGYANLESFGVGPQPISKSGANVYIQGSSGSIELHPPEGANHGGYIDFHYNGDTSNYTSRLIEDSSNFQLVSTNKNVVVKADDSGKQVILSAAANNAVLTQQPTSTSDDSLAIATVGWVLRKKYISTVEDKWSDAIALLESMLTSDPMHLYVKNTTTEPTSAQDGSYAHPFKYLHQCQTKIQTRRFIGGAWCYIHMLSNYSITSSNDQFNDTVRFSHPDMLSERFIEIIGCNGLTKDECESLVNGRYKQASERTTITIDNSDITTYYKNPLLTICNLQIRNIYIVSKRNGKTADVYLNTAGEGGGPVPMSQREDAIYNFSMAQTAVTASTQGSSGRIDIIDCKIEGFRWGIVGRGALSGSNEFKDCTRGITASIGQYTLGGTLHMTGYSGFPICTNSTSGSILIHYTSKFIVDNCRYVPIALDGGALSFMTADNNMPSSQERGIDVSMWMGDGVSPRNVIYELNYEAAENKAIIIRDCIKRLVGVGSTQMLTAPLAINDNVTGLDTGTSPIGRGNIFGTIRIEMPSVALQPRVAKWLGLA